MPFQGVGPKGATLRPRFSPRRDLRKGPLRDEPTTRTTSFCRCAARCTSNPAVGAAVGSSRSAVLALARYKIVNGEVILTPEPTAAAPGKPFEQGQLQHASLDQGENASRTPVDARRSQRRPRHPRLPSPPPQPQRRRLQSWRRRSCPASTASWTPPRRPQVTRAASCSHPPHHLPAYTRHAQRKNACAPVLRRRTVVRGGRRDGRRRRPGVWRHRGAERRQRGAHRPDELAHLVRHGPGRLVHLVRDGAGRRAGRRAGRPHGRAGGAHQLSGRRRGGRVWIRQPGRQGPPPPAPSLCFAPWRVGGGGGGGNVAVGQHVWH